MTTPATSGWYDDPEDPSYLRYFDGVVWSDHRAPKELPAAPEPEPVAPAQAPWGAPGAGGATAWGGGQQAPWGQQGQQGHGGPQPWNPQGQQQWNPHGQQQWNPQGQQPWAQQPYAQQPWGMPQDSLHGRPLASWGSRVGALVLDALTAGLVFGLVTLPLTMPFATAAQEYMLEVFSGNLDAEPPAIDVRFLAGSLLVGLLYWLYDTVCTMRWGRTLGKKIVGIRVVSVAAPERLGFGPSALRALVKHADSILGNVPIVSTLLAVFSLLDYLWPLWDKPLRQSLHDKVAKSAVLKD